MNSDDTSVVGSILRALERGGAVYRMTLDGEPVWWLMRNHVYKALFNELSCRPGSGRMGPRSFQAILRELAHAAIMLCRAALGFWRNWTIRGISDKVLLLVASNDYRAVSCGGSHQDVFLGDVARKLGRGAIIIERPTSLKWDLNSLFLRKDAIFLDYVFLRAFFYLIVHPGGSLTGWERVSDEIDTLSRQLSVDAAVVKSAILQQLKRLKSKMRLQLVAGRMLLDIVKPVSILEVTSYDSSVAAVNLAAKRRHVPVIEIQHGVIHSGHIGYSAAAPEDNCLDLMPIPDKILVYGSRFKQCLMEASPVYNDSSVEVVGSPRIAGFNARYDPSQRSSHRQAVSERLGLAKEGFWLTVTTQRPLAYRLVEFCRELLGTIPDNVFLCLKLHPDEAGDRSLPYYSLVQDPHVRIVTDSDVDLYELLISSDLHVSGYSTVLLEAMALGIPSFAIAFSGTPFASGFFKGVNIPTVNSPAELAEVIHKLWCDFTWRSSLIGEASKLAEDFFAISIQDPAGAIVDKVLACSCGENMSAGSVAGYRDLTYRLGR